VKNLRSVFHQLLLGLPAVLLLQSLMLMLANPAQAASYCECVGYIKRVVGIPDATSTADAADWDNNVLTKYGYQGSSTPKVGAIVVIERKGGFNATYGHIAQVVGIQNGKILIEGANQGGNGTKNGCSNVNTITVTPNSYMSYWVKGSSNGGFNRVNFAGTVMNRSGITLRNSPRSNDLSGYGIGYGQRWNFEGWAIGDTVTDLVTGKPDNRWFKLSGYNYWVPSGWINGNP
jgi:CHAP domain